LGDRALARGGDMWRYLLAGAALAVVLVANPLDAATTYTYDNLGRLSIVTYDNGMQIVYTYDGAGNRTSVVTQSGSVLPPVAVNYNIKVNEGAATAPFNPLTNDSDPQNYTLTISSVGTPAVNGATVAHTSNSITYTPKSGYTGNDSFTYTVFDQHTGYATATVFVTVTNVGPIAVADAVSTPINAAITYYPLSNDTEPNPPGYSLAIQSAATPAHGTVSIGNGNTSLTYTPTSNYVGSDIFNYTITDGHGMTSTASETITVGQPPVVASYYASTALNTAATFDPLTSDSDPNNLTITISSLGTPSHGTATIVSSGNGITYTPNNNFSGLDSFAYTVTDTRNLSASGTNYVCAGNALTANNVGVNLHNIAILNPEYPATTFDPRSSDTDSCNSSFSVTNVGQPMYGSASANASGTGVTYTFGTYMSTLNQFQEIKQTDSFTYTITDSYGISSTATVTVNIDVEFEGNL
jgi:large repetitive protein